MRARARGVCGAGGQFMIGGSALLVAPGQDDALPPCAPRRLGPADTLYTGLGTSYLPSAAVPQLLGELQGCPVEHLQVAVRRYSM